MKLQWVSIRRAGLALAVLAGFGATAIESAQADPGSRKTDRQIRIFERIVDDMLVESPNFLVRNGEPTRGMYVEGRGAIFSFRTSLVDAGGRHGRHRWWSFWDDDDDWDDDDRDRRSSRRYRERSLERQERRFERGKDEIVDTIVDFGDVLTTLSDGEYLEIEARLRSAEYFDEKDLRRLTYKVKLGDVRAYADQQISEEQLIARIQMEAS